MQLLLTVFVAVLVFARPAAPQTITLPASTTLHLALMDPLWAANTRPGTVVHLQTAFPFTIENRLAIPAGTFVEGAIDILVRPSLLSPHAEIRIYFTNVIFANGYTVQLPGPVLDASGTELRCGAANAVITVQVTSRNDVLLDAGAPAEMVIAQPLPLDAGRVAAAVGASKAPQPPHKSSTRCRPAPGTPGTPDTVIPGTPPGAPTVIPGGPGMPDTVIPGTPGTPATVIPGTPATDGLPCPAPPVAGLKPLAHRESFHIRSVATVPGATLSPGGYQADWEGIGPDAQIRISQKARTVATIPAQVVALRQNAPETRAATRVRPDGSESLESLQFKGKAFALRFDQ